MAGDRKFKEHILGHRACANIVDNKGPFFIPGTGFDDNANVGELLVDDPCHQVAGLIVLWFFADGQCLAVALKETSKIGHSPVVDVAIRFF